MTMPEKIRILAADKLAQEGLDFIAAQPDAELVNKPGLTEEQYAQLLTECDGMLVRSGIKVTAAMLKNPGRLKAIARAGVGVDNIDLDAATAAGIVVMNSAEASTTSTAEHAFALLMALARQIGPAYVKVSTGGWDRNKFMGRQLSGKTLGVIGFGRIGQTVALRAMAFGMTVVAYDPFINAPTMLDGKVRMFTDFKALLPFADMLTFHVPLNDQTKGMLNDETFKLCRKGVMVVNASRGGVIDEQALVRALDAKLCGGAALDVFEEEPPAVDSPLRSHPLILSTPHLGASTHEAQLAVSVAAAEQLLEFLRGQGIRGAVNAGGLRVDLTPVQQAFVDLVSRMTLLVSPMITRGISQVTFEISGKAITPVAGTIERMGLVGLLKNYLDTPVNVVNVAHVAQQRGIKVATIKVEETGKELDTGPQLSIEIKGPAGAVDEKTPHGEETRRIVGRVLADMRPRVTEINRYFMDMVPAGTMVLIQNQDLPGRIGMVGMEFGNAGVNIADMAISRRGDTALMVLKIDDQPPAALIESLRQKPGILKVAVVKLPPEKNAGH
jgi:D-3-phosphoglycerate dehydrogenase